MIKHFYLFIFLILMSSLGFSETCTITLNERQIKTINIKDLNEKSELIKSIQTTSAHECFQNALDYATEMDDSNGQLVIMADVWENDRIIGTNQYRKIVRWKYNDGYIDDSDGAVTKYTEKCAKKEKLNLNQNFIGNLRYWKDCSKF